MEIPSENIINTLRLSSFFLEKQLRAHKQQYNHKHLIPSKGLTNTKSSKAFQKS